MPRVVVAGGGLAGLAAAAALGQAGVEVDVLESRPFLGGRATSYDAGGETIDNCQHVLLRCCANLLDFYRRLGSSGDIEFHGTYYFVEPGGRVSEFRRGLVPFLGLKFLGLQDKLGIARALLKTSRPDPSAASITMAEWLERQRQTPRAVERFWRQILVSAVNEELDRMAASHGLQVFRDGFLASPTAYEMGIPKVPLGQLYAAERWQSIPNVRLHLRTPVERLLPLVPEWPADAVIVALPFERVQALAPSLVPASTAWQHSPITGIHLWFDRPITTLPHATLLDRTIQWLFNKSEGRHVQLVVSASRSLVNLDRGEVIALALRELAEFFPAAAGARLEKAHVVKEVRATFSATPDLEPLRPGTATPVPGLYLAGDWTRTGWPATMEGAVRSGYLAAEAVMAQLGRPQRFLVG